MPRSSERLPYRKKELEMADLLLHRLARRPSGAALEQLQGRSPESYKRWWIDGVGQIQPDGSHRRLVTDAETDRVHGVIEVLEIALLETERKITERAVHITDVMKQHALNVLAEEREPQLDVVKEQRVSA